MRILAKTPLIWKNVLPFFKIVLSMINKFRTQTILKTHNIDADKYCLFMEHLEGEWTKHLPQSMFC